MSGHGTGALPAPSGPLAESGSRGPGGRLPEGGPERVRQGGEAVAAAAVRRMLLNAASLLGAYVLPRGLTFLAAVVAARVLGPGLFGVYGTAASFAMIFSIGVSLGMLPLLVRDLAREPERSAELLGAAHALKAGAAVLTLALLVAVARWGLGYPPTLVAAAALLGLGWVFAAFAENIGAWFQARERMGVWVEGSLVFGVVAGAGGAVVVLATRSVVWFCAAFAAGQLASLLWLRYRMGAAVALARVRRGDIVRLARATGPFALAFFALTVFYKFDVLLLEGLRPGEAVGLYAAGYKLVDVVHALAVVASGAIYPRLARLTGGERATDAPRRALELFLLAAVPAAAALWLVREPLTLLLFGEAYGATAAALGLLAPAVAVLALNILAGYLLSIAGRVGLLAAAYTAGFLLKLALGLLWIPAAGAQGAALAMLVSELALGAVLLGMLGWIGLGVPGGRTAALAAGAAALAAGLIPLVGAGSAPSLAAAGYVLAVAVLYWRGGALSGAEVRAVRGAIAPLMGTRRGGAG